MHTIFFSQITGFLSVIFSSYDTSCVLNRQFQFGAKSSSGSTHDSKHILLVRNDGAGGWRVDHVPLNFEILVDLHSGLPALSQTPVDEGYRIITPLLAHRGTLSTIPRVSLVVRVMAPSYHVLPLEVQGMP